MMLMLFFLRRRNDEVNKRMMVQPQKRREKERRRGEKGKEREEEVQYPGSTHAAGAQGHGPKMKTGPGRKTLPPLRCPTGAKNRTTESEACVAVDAAALRRFGSLVSCTSF